MAVENIEDRWVVTYYDKASEGGERRLSRIHDTQLKAELHFLENGSHKSSSEFGSVSFAGVAQHFLNQLPGQFASESTILGYQRMVRDYINPQIGAIAIGILSEDHLRPLLLAMRDRKKKPKSATKDRIANAPASELDAEPEIPLKSLLRGVKTALSVILDFAVTERYIAFNPLNPIRQGFWQPEPKFRGIRELANDELELLHSKAGCVDAACLALMTECGLLPGEVEAMVWACCDFARREIFLPHPILAGDDPANPAGRKLPMTDRVFVTLLMLRSYQRCEHGHLLDYLVRSGMAWKRMHNLQIQSGVVLNLPGKAGAKDTIAARFKPSDFRNSAARLFVTRGARAKMLSVLLNLSSRQIYLRYRAMLDAHPAKSPIEAAHIASNMVLAKIEQIGLSAPAYSDQTPKIMETRAA